MLTLLKNKGLTKFNIQQLDRYMQNVGGPQFSYDVFKAAYDSDNKIKGLIKDFDQDSITLKTRELDDIGSTSTAKKDVVGQMAKRATKIGS